MVQFHCLNYRMIACYSNYIHGPWLPQGRNCLKSRGRGPIDPNWSVISQDCKVGDALAADDKHMLIQCSFSASLFDFWTAFPFCQPLLGWAGVVACTVSCVKPECKEAPAAVENWGHSTRVNQLEQIVLEPPGFCRHVLIPAHHVPAFTLTNPYSQLPWQQLMDSKNVQVFQLYCSLLLTLAWKKRYPNI